MKNLPAIVLTKDRYRPFTVNMVAAYDELWPGHSLEFLVPYQSDNRSRSQVRRSRLTFVRTGDSFQDTMLGLLKGMEQEDWVYFCIDDKFPTRLNVPVMSQVMKSVSERHDELDEVAGLAFTRARRSLRWPGISITRTQCFGQQAYQRADLSNFWFHQLFRVKVLRAFFQSLPIVSAPKEMDGHGKTLNLGLRFMTTKNHNLSLAESTSRGRITSAALKSLNARGIAVESQFLENGVAEIEPMQPQGILDYSSLRVHDLVSSLANLMRKSWT